MSQAYKNLVQSLCEASPFEINLNQPVNGKIPNLATSEFLSNKVQGDWAEKILLEAINRDQTQYIAVKYGRDDNLCAGEEGFEALFAEHEAELNRIGKRPDLLVFDRSFYRQEFDLNDPLVVSRAIAAIEVRSSSFLLDVYRSVKAERARNIHERIQEIKQRLLSNEMSEILLRNKPSIYQSLQELNQNNALSFSFNLRGKWSSQEECRPIREGLLNIRELIKTLATRDFLTITPKLEDIALVNKWIQLFGVKHFYAQVFFDRGVIIPFTRILEITNEPSNEGVMYEEGNDQRNQMKKTLKVNVSAGLEILSGVVPPDNISAALKNLGSGRQIYYVTFQGGSGTLNRETFMNEVINGN